MKVENLCVKYGDLTVFDDFSVEFEDKKISVVMGASGVGKTTLLNAVAGLIPFEGRMDEVGEVSYIFQNDRLIPSISVYKNLDLVLRARVMDKKERRRRIENMLDELQIKELMNKLPTALSGGERQRVALARAYLYESDVLLLDEPFKQLDPALKARLMEQLSKLHERDGRTVIFVTHSVEECMLVADRYFVLSSSPAKVVMAGDIETPRGQRQPSDLPELRAKLLDTLYE